MLNPQDVELICTGRHGDPFSVLGPHAQEGGTSLRAFLPGARQVEDVTIALQHNIGLGGAAVVTLYEKVA